MWIIKVALNRPYTFIVLALLILILSAVMILRTPVDIFPNIDIPVISVAWNYTGGSLWYLQSEWSCLSRCGLGLKN
ncbi:MAG TPA: efflux RND transporter permease subunit [Opitutaceae bacterium]|nr:efflux RND transporter permease subunit [Opitutaceae bacterium]